MGLHMHNQRTKITLTCVAIVFLSNCLSASANEEPSKLEYVAMSSRAWKHFQCAYLATTATNSAYSGSLFMERGFVLGKLYLQALKETKIDLMDLTLKVPRPFFPNDSDLPIEFQLGRISKDAENEILGEILILNGEDIGNFREVQAEKLQKNARSMLVINNCDFNDLGLDGEKLNNFQKNMQIDFQQKLPKPDTTKP